MERYTIGVEGMACDGCEETVERAASAVEGVRRVDADHEHDAVTVGAEGDTGSAVREAIEDAGYEVSG